MSILNELAAKAEEQAAEFAAAVAEEESCGGAMITSTPFAVALKEGPVRAALVESGVIRTVTVKAHLCGFTCMGRQDAERVAAILNEEGNHFEVVAVSSMAAACRDYYRSHAADMREVIALNK